MENFPFLHVLKLRYMYGGPTYGGRVKVWQLYVAMHDSVVSSVVVS